MTRTDSNFASPRRAPRTSAALPLSKLLGAALVAASACAPLAAQNLVQGGDFADPNLPNWTLGGGSYLTQVKPVDINGDSQKTNVLAVCPGIAGQSAFRISQPLKTPLVPQQDYYFRLDIRGSQPTGIWPDSHIEAALGTSQQPGKQGNILGLANQWTFVHRQVAGKTIGQLYESGHRFTATGAHTHLTIVLWLSSPPSTTAQQIYLDNIELMPVAQLPRTTCTADRGNVLPNVPVRLSYRTFATPGSAYQLLLSLGRLQPGLQLPGIGGALELNPALGLFVVFAGVTNARAKMTFRSSSPRQ
jgi:hypothetical protein